MTYKGFEIKYTNKQAIMSSYYAIFKDGYLFSCMAFISVKAAQNVIDTHLKFNS